MKTDYKKNKLQILTFIILGAIPLFVDSYYLDNISYFMCWTFISLGLAVIWGMGGILSFGQTAFFGLAGYGFSVISINFLGIAGVSLWSIVLALMLTGIFGLIVGYFLFYGGIVSFFFSVLYWLKIFVAFLKVSIIQNKSLLPWLIFGLFLANNTGGSMISDLFFAQFALFYYYYISLNNASN